MNKHLPSLKAKPELIPLVLRCIRDNPGKYKKMEDCIATLWQEKSLRVKKPTIRNSLRAVFGPSLRHLQLIRGEGDSLILMPAGRKLLQSYETEDEAGFKSAFAKHFVRLDRDDGISVLSELERLDGSVPIEVLLTRLKALNSETAITKDRLRKFLLYCSYLNLVKLRDGKVELRKRQFRNSLYGIDVRLSDNEFIQALSQEYNKILAKISGSPYVAIPDLRDNVCETTGISPDYFYKKLEEIPKETSRYLIHLTEPMQRKSGGIRLAGRYLYYAAVYKKQKEAIK
jgi:hypothetical protein